MKTLSDYSIYCTESQTRKAMELGAPIEPQTPSTLIDTLCAFCGDGMYIIPTAEQLIGWLEEQGILIETAAGMTKWYGYAHNGKQYINREGYSSRKEATLAAIDAALNYLNKNEKNG